VEGDVGKYATDEEEEEEEEEEDEANIFWALSIIMKNPSSLYFQEGHDLGNTMKA
jgi:hypothetical protein